MLNAAQRIDSNLTTWTNPFYQNLTYTVPGNVLVIEESTATYDVGSFQSVKNYTDHRALQVGVAAQVTAPFGWFGASADASMLTTILGKKSKIVQLVSRVYSVYSLSVNIASLKATPKVRTKSASGNSYIKKLLRVCVCVVLV